MSKIPHKIGPYILRGVIGEGAFSHVVLAFHETQKTYYACKIVPKARLSSSSLEERFEEEIRINQQLHHPGVVGLIDIIKDETNYYVVMEFCPNGELFQFIVDRGRLSEAEAKPKIKMILDTVRYLHSLGISHRDLKPENILLDQYGNPKVSDFGLSRFVGPDNLVSTPCGSPCYASPECISGQNYNGLTSDVWSCGVVLFAMVTGQLPWTKRNQSQLFEQIRNGDYTIPNFLSVQCASLISGLMTVDSEERLTVEQALHHQWLIQTPNLESASFVAPCISMKRIDDFFDKSVSSLRLPATMQRKISCDAFSFESTLRQIGVNEPEVKVRKKVRKVLCRRSVKIEERPDIEQEVHQEKRIKKIKKRITKYKPQEVIEA
ncbi:CAMK family protein kinase [Trichomonas vaginalis G3]|uniref:CAMK family protein kinase n=1 Tax=Trichomonas vaginalis (strain ATCC PRA-98 / G3) TaxID=412133 RepID=A2E2X1_TRIV3|nr:protein serine/threonine kinase protein [Trichomonas vaginalis G3]EAY13026.1 CAMK family protein kinase [Trichomonas vaginalis G3]KAI5503072.1 protein serine/threonine kinase protein [Trichomonas vaginalis G3]|eukprot:XP_001325249.1 CAMK family protein kinase [Trichomonas vaginalis G3]